MQTLRIVGKASHVKFINSLWRIVPYSCVDASNNNNSYYTDDCFLSKSGGEGDKREGEKKRKEKKRKRTEGEGSESLIEFLKSSNSDSNFSRGENDSRVNLRRLKRNIRWPFISIFASTISTLVSYISCMYKLSRTPTRLVRRE